MAIRAAAAAAARRHLQSLYNDARPCKFVFRNRVVESLKPPRIYGAPPESLQQHVPSKIAFRWCLPEDYVAPAPYVFEKNLAIRKRLPECSHASDVFIRYLDKDNREYFTAHSVEEDGSITPKYYIYAPSQIKEKGCVFSNASCNGVFHFLNREGDHHLWSPTTNELKSLPKSFDLLPRIKRRSVLDIGLWCNLRCDDYKVLQVVQNQMDMSGILDDISFHIELYSSKSNSWKIIPCNRFCPISSFASPCINGVFYFPARSWEERTDVIASFDFSTETLSALPAPQATRCLHTLAVFEYNGLPSLLMFSVRETPPSSYILWVMEKFWVRESVFTACGIHKPICFSKSGGLLYLESMNDEVLVFDRATGKLKQLGLHCFSNRIKFHPVPESSFQLNGVSDIQEPGKNDGCMIEANEGPLILA